MSAPRHLRRPVPLFIPAAYECGRCHHRPHRALPCEATIPSCTGRHCERYLPNLRMFPNSLGLHYHRCPCRPSFTEITQA